MNENAKMVSKSLNKVHNTPKLDWDSAVGKGRKAGNGKKKLPLGSLRSPISFLFDPVIFFFPH